MAFLIAFVSIGAADAATLVGGDYAGADLIPAEGDVLEGAFTNVGTFHVPPDVHVFVQSGVPLVVEADVVLIDGYLDGDGAGFKGGTRDAQGEGPGGGPTTKGQGASGAGYGHIGGRGPWGEVGQCENPDTPGGPAYGTHDDPLDAPLGSGGGASDCGHGLGDEFTGGDGGGSITLRAEVITIAADGAVSADGGQGDPWDFCFGPFGGFYNYGGPGNGGGSGGSLVLDATLVVQVDGVLSAKGGRGGDGEDVDGARATGGGGGGAGGRIKIHGPLIGSIHRPNVAGAKGGDGDDYEDGFPPCIDGGNGGHGTIYVDGLVTTVPPTITATGACGSITFTVTGGTPYGRFKVVTGEAMGGDELHGGVCSGVATDLENPSMLAQRMLDETGAWSLTGTGPLCGGLVQVVDLWSCTTSAVVTLP